MQLVFDTEKVNNCCCFKNFLVYFPFELMLQTVILLEENISLEGFKLCVSHIETMEKMKCCITAESDVIKHAYWYAGVSKA